VTRQDDPASEAISSLQRVATREHRRAESAAANSLFSPVLPEMNSQFRRINHML
jgi:hypothetical protein